MDLEKNSSAIFSFHSNFCVKEDTGGIQTGDAITFYRHGELVTHRVVEINADEKTYITKVQLLISVKITVAT